MALSKGFGRKEPEHKINDKIRSSEVRLVGDNITAGIYSFYEAMKIARNLELDLVEISNGNPPICKVIDYGKFLYEKSKKEKENKAKSKQLETKEIRFTSNTDDHDFNFKSKHGENFLKEGNKVRAYVQFKGRDILFKERGELILLKFAERLSEFGNAESLPKLEGKKMFLVLNPKKK